MEIIERKIEHSSTRSLVWQDDHLVDWVGGGTRFTMDGAVMPASVYFAGDFDAAIATSSGDIVVIYKRLGTKAIVLENGRVEREINRSYYHADVYEYPICLWESKERPAALVHCPDEYNQLEIEDAVTGERISFSEKRTPPDFFHSRLSISPSGTYLMSAGWVWHPMDIANIYRLPTSDGLADLDSPFATVDTANEVSTCAWINDTSVLAANSDDYEYEEGEPFTAGALGRWSLRSKKWSNLSVPTTTLGLLMPLGEDHVISFFEYPKLLRISDGAVIKEWPHIGSGKQTSSIIHHIDTLPPIAINREGMRFSVANEDCIHVISFEK